MRQGQHSKKNRGRGRRPSNPGSRVYESNGPDVKIRGNAPHVSEKYLALARDAQVSGDPISAENYLQHAEHYLRIIAASQAQQQSQAQPCAPEDEARPGGGGGRGNGASRSRGGAGRGNGDGRRGEARAAAKDDDGAVEEAAAEANGETADLSETAEETVVTVASDEPDSAAEKAEETVPEAG